MFLTRTTTANDETLDGVGLTDLYSWNPSLSSTACSFNVGQQYCVQYLPLNHTDITASCRRTHVSGPGETCKDVMSNYRVQMDQFYAWNPSVGTTCQNWKNGKIRLLYGLGIVLNLSQDISTVLKLHTSSKQALYRLAINLPWRMRPTGLRYRVRS